MLRLVGLLLMTLLAGAVLVLAAAAAAASSTTTSSLDELALRVTLAALDRVPSSQHSFSQLELLNLHNTEHIVVRSLQPSPDGEETFVRYPAPSYDDNDEEGFRVPDLPRQLHVSRLPHPNGLVLAPGQAAVVPLTFLPRFPAVPSCGGQHQPSSSTTTLPNSGPGGGTTTTTILSSPWRLHDDYDWWGLPRVSAAAAAAQRRFVPPTMATVLDDDDDLNNKHNDNTTGRTKNEDNTDHDDDRDHGYIYAAIYTVQTNLLIETSRGRAIIPVTATSVRRNDFGVPDLILFGDHHPGSTPPTHDDDDINYLQTLDRVPPPLSVNEDDDDDDDSNDDTINNNNRSVSHTIRRDCYDVYLKHPNRQWHALDDMYLDDDVQVLEALVSRPEHVVLSIDAWKHQHQDHQSSSGASSTPSCAPPGGQFLRDCWTDAGPLKIPNDGNKHYVLTVCPANRSTDGSLPSSSSSPSSPLMETNKNNNKDEAAARTYLQEMEHWVSEANVNSMGFLHLRLDTDSLFVSLEWATSTLAAGEAAAASPSKKMDDDVENRTATENGTTLLSSLPMSSLLRLANGPLIFRFLSSASPTNQQNVSVINHHEKAVRLMRAAVHVNVEKEHLIQGVSVKISHLETTKSIEAGATLDDAMQVEVVVDSAVFGGDLRTLRGCVILRGTSDELDYDEWELAMSRELSLDADYILEVPLLIEIAQGRVAVSLEPGNRPGLSSSLTEPWVDNVAAVTALFFPRNGPTSRTLRGMRDTTFLDSKSIYQSLRVLSSHEILNLTVSGASVISGEVTGASEESPCSRFIVKISPCDRSMPSEAPELVNLGAVELHYTFPLNNPRQSFAPSVTVDVFPVECFLSLTTLPSTGEHLTPLVLYSGQVDVSTSLFSSDKVSSEMSTCEDDSIWHHAVVGFDSLVKWFQQSKFSAAVRSALDFSMDSRKVADKDAILLGRYLYSLARHSVDLDNSRLRPVLLKVGAIEQGQLETIPLYFTNYNPVAMQISIDVGEVEGIGISLGRDQVVGRGDGQSILDQIRKSVKEDASRFVAGQESLLTYGEFTGSPLNGLRQFLVADELAGAFLNQFQYRDAVSLSESALSVFPMFRSLYHTTRVVRFYKSLIASRTPPVERKGCNHSMFPAEYGLFEKNIRGKRMPGPLIVSNDGKTARRLPICWDKAAEEEGYKVDGTVMVLPPGGVARFDIHIRSPPTNVLNKDITEFLATGIVLSTNHGDVIPIFVTFEALKGKLEVSHAQNHVFVNVTGQQAGRRIIEVPVGLFARSRVDGMRSIKIPAKLPRSLGDMEREYVGHNTSELGSVPMFMRSSFNRNVRLLKITSCNPWFQLALADPIEGAVSDPFYGVKVGVMRSFVPCDVKLSKGTSESSTFPSFFRCALEWLGRKPELQPRGCGQLSMNQRRNDEADGMQQAERGLVERATLAFHRAMLLSELPQVKLAASSTSLLPSDGEKLNSKSGRRTWDGIVALKIIDAFAEAWESWKLLSDVDFQTMSTSLRAIVEYNSTSQEKSLLRPSSWVSEEESHLLSLALHNVTVQTVLRTPKLFFLNSALTFAADAELGDETRPSMIEFHPMPVAQVQSLMIPIKNPTGVPIRVRLAVAPRLQREEIVTDDATSTPAKSGSHARSRYMGSRSAPYVQTARAIPSIDPVEVANRHWWDGGGAFFLSDLHGDVTRSHHNVSIRAGKAGARVSLINPSLLANNALSVGCGERCGRRDEVARKSGDTHTDIRMSSPIGASAVLGSVLVGHRRHTLGEEAGWPAHESFVASGASLLSVHDGPSPFAIPFSSLDEVVVPPFGEVELGPVLFRPPGRSRYVGCAPDYPSAMPDYCHSRSFESMLLLENSLTGLERVVLRGKAMWERVVFVDPDFDEISGVFGNLHVRDGQLTLMFNASGDDYAGTDGRFVKEVLVRNEGDALARFTHAEIVAIGTADRQTSKLSGRERACEVGGFLLLDCLPFTLAPGEVHSILIEHRSLCTSKSEAVMLRLNYDRANGVKDGRGLLLRKGDNPERHMLWSSKTQENPRRSSVFFEKDNEQLLVQFIGKTGDPRKCSLPAMHLAEPSRNRSGERRRNRSGERRRQKEEPAWYALLEIAVISVIVASSIFVVSKVSLRQAGTRDFQNSMMRRSEIGEHHDKTIKSSTIWPSDFHRLARTDPSSSDLQMLGREQVRRIVLAKYKAAGILPPQCFSGSGALQRERGGMAGNMRRQSTTGNDGSSDRTRTLSDSIFRQFSVRKIAEAGLLPCELSWRAAISRGVINESLLQQPLVNLQSKALLQSRMNHSSSTNASFEGSYDTSIISNDSEAESDDETFHASGEIDMNPEQLTESNGELDVGYMKLLEVDYPENARRRERDVTLDAMNTRGATNITISSLKEDRPLDAALRSPVVSNGGLGLVGNSPEKEAVDNDGGTPGIDVNGSISPTLSNAAFESVKERKQRAPPRVGRRRLDAKAKKLATSDSTLQSQSRSKKRDSNRAVQNESSKRKSASRKESQPIPLSPLTSAPRTPDGLISGVLAPPPGFGEASQPYANLRDSPLTRALLATSQSNENLPVDLLLPPMSMIRNESSDAQLPSSSIGLESSLMELSQPLTRLRNTLNTSSTTFDPISPPRLLSATSSPEDRTTARTTTSLDLRSGLNRNAGSEGGGGGLLLLSEPPLMMDTACFHHETSGFDILEFLDGILNDTTTTTTTPTPTMVITDAPVLLSSPSTSPSHVVLANPWADKADDDGVDDFDDGGMDLHHHLIRQSRALDYGISMEDTSERNNQHHVTNDDLLLLTPAAILADNKADPIMLRDDEEEEKY